VNEFSIFALLDHYLQVVAEYDVALPDGFRSHIPVARQLKDVLEATRMDSLPCHNDLIAENFIDDGRILRFVDFEYSGNNDPCFELGNVAMSLEYDEGMTLQLCEAYFGELSKHTLARVQLFALAAHLTWTAWSCIQHKVSNVDYDFWWNAHYHWNPALETMQSDAFLAWMEEAQK
jgi:thiamine kinase-like enzyme